MLAFRRFEDADWDEYGVAETFENGVQPVIAPIRVRLESGETVDGVVIVEKLGGEIGYWDKGEYVSWDVMNPQVVFAIEPETSVDEIKSLGMLLK
jgi:hypothetical protein